MLKEKRKKKNITEKISETKNRCFRKQLTKFQISKKCAKEQKKKEREREKERRHKLPISGIIGNVITDTADHKWIRNTLKTLYT